MEFSFDIDEIKALVNGDFNFRTCIDCHGLGTHIVDGESGDTVISRDPSRDPEDFYIHGCETCFGLGGKIIF